MTELDLGAVRSSGSYFLRAPTGATPFTQEDTEQGFYRHCFTYRGSRESIREEAVRLINNARRKIFVASFRIGDTKILDALFAAVERLHGRVYIITSWNERTLSDGMAQIEDDDGADVAAQKKRFDDLTRRGIFVRGHEDCHAKFIVIDDSDALVSSANLETSALTDAQTSATGESGVVISDPTEVDRLGRFFTRLWHEGCTWQAPPGSEYALQRRTPTSSPAAVTQRSKPPCVIWTDGDERGILAALHEVVELAQHELILATFSLVGIREHPDMLLEPLQRALTQKHLDVHLLVRSKNQFPGHRADAAALADIGVHIHGDHKTHAKGVIADGRYGALFSANFDADHGVYNGVEVGVRLDGQRALVEAHRYLRHCIDYADSELAASPMQRELDRRLSAQWQRQWSPREAKIEIRATDSTWLTLCRQAHSGPVLWENQNGTLHLFAGDHDFSLDPDTNGTPLLEANQASLTADSRMQKWYEQRKPEPRSKAQRGICPAILVRRP
jgi:phosphatidylserine/phosphatidylglycerophosphate/cardiolipin synthase-like enzyme